MVEIALVLIALGFIGLVVGVMQRLKAGRVADAPLVKTGDAAARGAAVANPKGGLSAEGSVVCQQPLVSPVTGVPCLYYQLKVTASWKDGDTQKSKELTKEKRAAQFAIDDGSGPVWVDAREGGDFEPTQKKEETKSTSLLGGITGQDLVFGNYRVSTGLLSLGTKYEVVEEVLPVVPRLYACGKTGAGAIAAPGWRSLILSSKTRDELLAGAAKSAKMFLGGGAGAFVTGIALAVVASLTAPPAKAAVATTASADAPAETDTATAAPVASTPAPASKPSASKAGRAPKPKR